MQIHTNVFPYTQFVGSSQSILSPWIAKVNLSSTTNVDLMTSELKYMPLLIVLVCITQINMNRAFIRV